MEEFATTPEAREQRRRQTLSALGIEPLVSRFDAPYGKASVRFTELESASYEDIGSQVGAEQQSAQGERLDGLEASSAMTKDGPQGALKSLAPHPSRQPESGQKVPAVAHNAARQTDAVAFHLLLVSAGGWLWIECLEDGLLHKEQLALVHNMAVAVSDPSVDLFHRQFVWPMAEHPHLPRDAVAARQSVNAQLERIGKETPYRGVVLMGEAVCQWVGSEDHPEIVRIPSTRQMLQAPMMKRDAWQVLKPLAQAKSAGSNS